MRSCPHGMPSPASCIECMEEGNFEASAPPRPPHRKREASLEGEHDERVYAAVRAAGPRGISLRELEEQTGLSYRILHNVVPWRLGARQNRVHLVPGSRPQRFAAGGPGAT